MSKSLFTYEASAVKVSVFGIEIKGLIADGFVTIERTSPVTSTKKAMDGSGTASIDPFGSFKVTLKIGASSESNTLLDLIYRVYIKSGANLRMPLIITDKNSGSTFTSLDTLFDGDPTKNYSQKSMPYDWVFQCENPSNSYIGYDDDTSLLSSLQRVLDFIDIAGSVGLDLNSISDKLTTSINDIKSKLTNLI